MARTDLRIMEIDGDLSEWWEPHDFTGTKRHRKAVAKGKRHFQVAVRVEPERAYLFQFGQAVAEVSGAALTREPTHEDKAIVLQFEHYAHDPAKAVEDVFFRLHRWLKRIGTPIARVSFDTREVPVEAARS